MRNYEAKLVDSSRLIADLLIEDIGRDAERFEEMLLLALRDEYPISMRAARIVALSVQKYPDLMEAHIDQVIQKLPELKIEGVKRGMLKLFTENSPELNEDQIGILTELAFTWVSDSKQAIAIRYYAIEILVRVCQQYPELKKELAIVCQGLVEDGSAGIVSRSKMVLKNYRKEGII